MGPLLQAGRYSAANARVHGLLAKLIPAAQWAEIISAPDLPSLVSLLRDTWYGPILPPEGEAEPTAIQIERALSNQVVATARLAFTLLQGGPRELLEWFWRRFEVDNLKTILRGVHHRTPPSQMQAAIVELGPGSDLAWHDLASVESVPALVERLRGTWYGRTLRPALDQYRQQQSVFPLEVALDLAYSGELLDRITKLGGGDRADAVTFLGGWLDAQNLLWAFRYRLYAHLSPEEILNYTIHRNLRVNADLVRTIALGAPLLDVVRSIWDERLSGLDDLANLPEQDALPRLELIFQRYFFSQAQRAWVTSPLRLATILAYTFLLEYEMRDLVAVVEGKSFGWTGESIRPYLIGERGL